MIWLIGACPSIPDDPPLLATNSRQSSADRLAGMLGMSAEVFNSSFQRINVLDSPPWDRRRASLSGRRIRKRVTTAAVVLGRDAWAALGLPRQTGYFESCNNFTLLPHPSGRNLMFNDSTVREMARRTIDEIMRAG